MALKDISEAFEKGKEDQINGIPRHKNPYMGIQIAPCDFGAADYYDSCLMSWNKGWDNAYRTAEVEPTESEARLRDLRMLAIANNTRPPGTVETLQAENRYAYRVYSYVISEAIETDLKKFLHWNLEKLNMEECEVISKKIIDYLVEKAYK